MTVKRFPQQNDCDMDDPEEHFLWALGQIPYGPYNQQIIQTSVARTISKHLYEVGFRFDPELQKKKQQMPQRGQQTVLNACARWADMDAEDPDPVVLPNVKAMTAHEQELMITELRNIGRLVDPPPQVSDMAQVSSVMDIVPTRIVYAKDLTKGE